MNDIGYVLSAILVEIPEKRHNRNQVLGAYLHSQLNHVVQSERGSNRLLPLLEHILVNNEVDRQTPDLDKIYKIRRSLARFEQAAPQLEEHYGSFSIQNSTLLVQYHEVLLFAR